MRKGFDVEQVKEKQKQFILDWHKRNGLDNAPDVLGVSGGKDSSACLGALVNARGADKVIAVLMPNGEQKDIADSIRVCEHFGVKYIVVNIGPMYETLTNQMRDVTPNGEPFPNGLYSTNTPARLRMITLYSIAALNHGVVVNTCNLSEDFVGYSTKWGDAVGDFSLLGKLLVSEVIELGKSLGVPVDLMEKAPSDGMCGATDEDKMGFTYDELEKYITEKVPDIPVGKALLISKMHDNPNTAKKIIIKEEDTFNPGL